MFTLALITLPCDTKFVATLEMSAMLSALIACPKGGFATIMGYRPSTGYTVRPLVDYTVNTRFSYHALLKRERAATEAITFASLASDILAEPKLRELSVEACEALFVERKAMRLESLDKSLNGDTSDAQRAAHARNYARISEGVRVHYITAPDDNGMMVPVLCRDTGLPMAEHIIVEGLQVSSKYRERGERKVVNSRAPTIMGNLIQNLAGKAHKFRSFKLTPEVCEGIRIGGEALDIAA